MQAEKDKERAAREAERLRPKPVKAELKPIATFEKAKQEEQIEQMTQVRSGASE